MNIVVVGSGAIGSLLGALLAKQNTVILVGRAPHITSIQQKGLLIKGKTHLTLKVPAVESIREITVPVDLILLTVKAYDTEAASSQLGPLIQEKTMVVSLQNGLENIQKMEQTIEKKHLLAGVTTQGALFQEPGVITHTGKGKTILGELDGKTSERLEALVQVFNQAGIETQISTNIEHEIWRKAIINSSINPLTGFLRCKNGYLLDNPLLEKTVEAVCKESCEIAAAHGIRVSPGEMIQKTKEVILDTAQNYSSMLQSILQRKRTEIDSINGALLRIGMQHRKDVSLNRILYDLISSSQKTN
jgi:2-dehydropantoate 2-reductase